MCALVFRTAKLNSKLSLSHLQLIWDQTQINTWTEHLEAHTSNPAGQFLPLINYNPCDCFYLSTEGVTMLTEFPRKRWPRQRFSESYTVRISVKVSRICESRVIIGIMTGLLGCCSSSTLGSKANDYVRSGFDCIIRPAPSDAGWTKPSQPSHYSLNNKIILQFLMTNTCDTHLTIPNHTDRNKSIALPFQTSTIRIGAVQVFGK